MIGPGLFEEADHEDHLVRRGCAVLEIIAQDGEDQGDLFVDFVDRDGFEFLFIRFRQPVEEGCTIRSEINLPFGAVPVCPVRIR